MPCNHRFQLDLSPNYRLEYLFIGTFNPSWENPNGNNANWFYGRRTNSFWRILPSVFYHDNLNNAFHRENVNLWKQYCFNNNIGVTDMIVSIEDANENNEEHRRRIFSFLDEELEVFQNILFTNIEELIINNLESLRGVFLTRYCHTLNQGGIFANRWNQIQILCEQNNINKGCLVTPSNGYMMPVVEKIELWRNQIN